MTFRATNQKYVLYYSQDLRENRHFGLFQCKHTVDYRVSKSKKCQGLQVQLEKKATYSGGGIFPDITFKKQMQLSVSIAEKI